MAIDSDIPQNVGAWYVPEGSALVCCVMQRQEGEDGCVCAATTPEAAQQIAQDHNRISNLEAEVRRHKAWVDDLQKGLYVNCVYCGHRYGPNPGTPVAMAEVLKTHILQCPEHPMYALKARCNRIEDLLALWVIMLWQERSIDKPVLDWAYARLGLAGAIEMPTWEECRYKSQAAVREILSQ